MNTQQTRLKVAGRTYRITDTAGVLLVETLVIGKNKAFWRELIPGRTRDLVVKEYHPKPLDTPPASVVVPGKQRPEEPLTHTSKGARLVHAVVQKALDNGSPSVVVPSGNMGCALAQRLVSALTLNGIPYNTLVDIVYGEMRAIAAEQKLGDWLEFPNGDTYTLTFKV